MFYWNNVSTSNIAFAMSTLGFHRLCWASLTIFVACGEGNGEPTVDGSIDAVNVPDGGALDAARADSSVPLPRPTIPKYQGFSLPVREGSWWLYGSEQSFGDIHEECNWLLQLGAPATIAGEPMFALQQTRLASKDCGEVALTECQFLGFFGQRITCSADGRTLAVVFDAVLERWMASRGFDATIRGSATAKEDMLSNGYFKGATLSVSATPVFADCVDLAGYEPVCTGDPFRAYSAKDHYAVGLGFVGMEATGCSSGGCVDSHVGLIDSSVDGSRPRPTRGELRYHNQCLDVADYTYRCLKRSGVWGGEGLTMCFGGSESEFLNCEECIVDLQGKDRCADGDPCYRRSYGSYCGSSLPIVNPGDENVLFHCEESRTESTKRCPGKCTPGASSGSRPVLLGKCEP